MYMFASLYYTSLKNVIYCFKIHQKYRVIELYIQNELQMISGHGILYIISTSLFSQQNVILNGDRYIATL